MIEIPRKDTSVPAYAIYEKATGKVVSSGISQRGRECEQIGNQHSPFSVMEHDYLLLDEPVDPNDYVVVDGALVKKPE